MGTTASQDSDFLASVISTRLLEDAIEWIASSLEPDDVFSEEQLVAWAEANGFVRKEESDA